MEIKIVNNDSVEVPAGQRGEVLVRGTAMFREYWRRPDVNATAWTAEGWFRTGDVALLDNEGYLYVVDRIKDLIIRGGENIGSGEVEAALLMHPDVHEAAVYGLPDERLGEQVGATIYANPTINVETLREFLHGHLARFEVPSHILTTDRPLPRTASGKIFKRQIRHEALIAMGTVKPGSAPIETTK
jgi:long-chain acyl-CoA synthetase